MWSQLDTNKIVAGLFPNDADGNAWGDKVVGLPPALDKAGFKLFDPGRYQNLTDNFSAQIAAFKAANAQILTGDRCLRQSCGHLFSAWERDWPSAWGAWAKSCGL